MLSTITQLNLTRRPAFRKLRAYSFDPSLSLRIDTVAINNLTYKVNWEALAPGPVGEYLEVIDYDPTVGRFYRPVDLNERHILAQEGLDPSESNPQFHQQMVYAVAMTTITNFENALGRKVLWAPENEHSSREKFVRRLRIYPHALRDANAFYSPLKKAVLFGYFSSAPADETLLMPDSIVFTCLSHDIIAHEVTHAILDGMHNYYNEATNPDVLAFHEAFADIVALFQHFTFPEVLKHQIARTRGDLHSQNLLGELAQQFGTAIGSYGSLRDAIGQHDPDTGKWQPKEPNADDYRQEMEPHARGSILVAAVFEAFLSIYKMRIADLLRISSGGSGILPQGELHLDLINRLAAEAAKAANHVLSMCIRALDYCPPVDLTFGEYLRAIITADADLVPDDQYDYRLAFIDAFRRRGIYPKGIKTLSVDSLLFRRWNIGSPLDRKEIRNRLWQNSDVYITEDDTYDDEPSQENTAGVDDNTNKMVTAINDFLREYADLVRYETDREAIYLVTKAFINGEIYKSGTQIKYGLHERVNEVFIEKSLFSRITGLDFGPPTTDLGVKASEAHPTVGPLFELQGLRLVNRVGPGNNQVNQVVFSIIQQSEVTIAHQQLVEPYVSAPSNGGLTAQVERMAFGFRGGCTLIFDLDTLKLQYAISKPLLDMQSIDTSSLRLDEARLFQQFNYQFGEASKGQNDYALYFGGHLHDLNEPFAFLHQH